MPKQLSKRRLGQYWTPPAIADLMLDIVKFDPHWKVIDPACGEGIFLQRALERGATQVVGVDIDPHAIERARELLQPYGDRVRLYQQDGLLPIDDPDPYWQGDYDLVIGNPPFAATGYRVRDIKILGRFELSQQPKPQNNHQGTLFEMDGPPRRRKPSVAIEVLFLERFHQLCKPNGRVCIIIPVSILANSNLRYVREWLIRNFTPRLILELPPNSFKHVGANALTSIMYIENRLHKPGHRVLLGQAPSLDWSDSSAVELNARYITKFVNAVHELLSLTD